jgi:hypothetical protein
MSSSKDVPLLEPYSTPDLYFAAALMAAHVPLKRHERVDGRIRFVFDDVANSVPDMRHDYHNHILQIDALTFADHIRSLKSLCHSDT